MGFKIIERYGYVDKYKLKFWFEHGGICIWAANNKAEQQYNLAIENDALPISQELITLLNSLEDEYAGCLDWEYPPDPSPWNEKQKQDFKSRAEKAYHILLNELGSDYTVENAIDSCIPKN